MSSSDIVIDTLKTLTALIERNGGVLLPTMHGEAERIVRAAWGGDRVYIAKLGEDGQRQLSARDRAIRTEFLRGDHVPLLARRHGISERRVRQIVATEREADAETPCLTDCRSPRQHADHAADRADSRARQPHRRRHGDLDPQPA